MNERPRIFILIAVLQIISVLLLIYFVVIDKNASLSASKMQTIQDNQSDMATKIDAMHKAMIDNGDIKTKEFSPSTDVE